MEERKKLLKSDANTIKSRSSKRRSTMFMTQTSMRRKLKSNG